MKRRFDLGHSRDGWRIYITDWPYHVVAREWVWDQLCTLTRGWIGGHGMPDLFWRIPIGKPRYYDDDPDLMANSIAWKLHDLEQWMLGHRPIEVTEIDIDEDVARKIDPEFVAEMTEED